MTLSQNRSSSLSPALSVSLFHLPLYVKKMKKEMKRRSRRRKGLRGKKGKKEEKRRGKRKEKLKEVGGNDKKRGEIRKSKNERDN
jgi:hypothetical protein